MCIGGFIDGAAQHSFEAVPLLWTFAYPGGLVERQTYDQLKAEFCDRFASSERDGGRIDGVLLDLHSTITHWEKPGELLERTSAGAQIVVSSETPTAMG